MQIKNITFKSGNDSLNTQNYSVKQLHKLNSDLNRLNPDSVISVTINFLNKKGGDRWTHKNFYILSVNLLLNYHLPGPDLIKCPSEIIISNT